MTRVMLHNRLAWLSGWSLRAGGLCVDAPMALDSRRCLLPDLGIDSSCPRFVILLRLMFNDQWTLKCSVNHSSMTFYLKEGN